MAILDGKSNVIAIVGTVGIPACYGGFETLVENLARFHQDKAMPGRLVVYCSSKAYRKRQNTYLGAELRYVGLKANGPASILYDVVSILSAARRCSVILVLGVGGTVALPLVRLFSRARVVTNVDGIEWKRKKWSNLARWWLHKSENWALRYSDEVLADNQGIATYLFEKYGRECAVIPYGGDHAVHCAAKAQREVVLPVDYALHVGRIEPENNVEMMLEAFSHLPGMPIVVVGNWGNSAYGKDLKQRFAEFSNLHLLDPVYDPGALHKIRSNARMYIHGQSVGGTSPALVEMMHFGVPIAAYDCVYNRHTTEDKALFFKDAQELASRVKALVPEAARDVGQDMQRVALERYTWDVVGQAYYDLFDRLAREGRVR